MARPTEPEAGGLPRDAAPKGQGAEPERDRTSMTRAEQRIEAQLAEVERMGTRALRAEWLRLYQFEAPPRLSKKILKLAVGWKIQERAYGGYSAATKRRLASIAKAIEEGRAIAPERTPRLRPGARLVREWHGRTYTVIVRDRGVEWCGEIWRSLSAIAREITGQQWSGPRFFGLTSARRQGPVDNSSPPETASDGR